MKFIFIPCILKINLYLVSTIVCKYIYYIVFFVNILLYSIFFINIFILLYCLEIYLFYCIICKYIYYIVFKIIYI